MIAAIVTATIEMMIILFVIGSYLHAQSLHKENNSWRSLQQMLCKRRPEMSQRLSFVVGISLITQIATYYYVAVHFMRRLRIAKRAGI